MLIINVVYILAGPEGLGYYLNSWPCKIARRITVFGLISSLYVKMQGVEYVYYFQNAINVLAKSFISIATTFIRQSKNISRRNVEIAA